MSKKKFLSIFMAALFIFNMVPVVLFPEKVEAATAIEADFYKYLKAGTGSDIPVYSNSATELPSDTIYLEYNVNANTDGVKLSYLLNSAAKVDFTVINEIDPVTGNTASYKVTYELNAWDAGTSAWSTTPPVFNPNVHHNNSGYITANNYATTVNVAGDANRIELGGAFGYQFRIVQGGGFCFEFQGTYVFFKIESGKLKYTTSNLADGFVYNFFLTNAATGALEDHIQASKGINMDTLDFIPIANGKFAALAGSNDNDTSIEYSGSYYKLDYNGGETPATTGTVSMAIRFEEPMELTMTNVGTTFDRVYRRLPDTEYDLEVKFNMFHNLTDQGNELRVIINDLLALQKDTLMNAGTEFDTNIAANPNSAAAQIGRVLTNAPLTNVSESGTYARFLQGFNPSNSIYEPRRAEIFIENLEPGMVFDGSVTTTVTKQNTVVCVEKHKGERVDYAAAYTFLAYCFNYDGLDNSIQFTPYRGYSGTYKIIISQTEYDVTWNGSAYISVPIISWLPNDYQIKFIPDNTAPVNSASIYSEITEYDPNNANVNFGAARSFRIDEYRHKPKINYTAPDIYGSSGYVDIEMSWLAGLEQALYSMTGGAGGTTDVQIKYDLTKSLSSDKSNTVKWGSVILTIKQDPINSGEYLVDYELYDDTLTYELDGAYNPANHLGSRLKDIYGNYQGGTGVSLTHEDGFLRFSVKVVDIPTTTGTNISAAMDALKGTHFYYEQIYYLCVETKPQMPGVDKKSNFDSMSLSGIVKLDVPPARDLKSVESLVEYTQIGFTWAVPAKQIQEYFFRTPYEPANADFRYNIYISQDEALMRNIASLTQNQIMALPTVAVYDFDTVEVTPAAAEPLFHMAASPALLADLRGENTDKTEKIVMIKDMDIDNPSLLTAAITSGQDFYYRLQVDGLDKNQTYYIYVNMEITHKDPPLLNPAYSDAVESSVLSILIGITTKNDGDEPTGEDKRPAAPNVLIKDVSIDAATIYWEYADVAAAGEYVYYEMIRTKGTQIPSKYIDSYLAFPELYTKLAGDMPNVETVVLRTPQSGIGTVPEIFNGTSWNTADSDDYTLVFGDNELEVHDKTLTSNEIYFYYVRTVRVSALGRIIYSVFNYNTCTTQAVAPPINLIIFAPGETSVAFDPVTELVFNFDAPFASDNALGTEYSLQYSIKLDNGDFSDPIDLNTATLKANAKVSAIPNHINYSYKLTGLKQGTMYSIRVRVVSLRSADTSAWSNTASTRTDMDQDDYFNDKAADEWMDYYKDLLTLNVKEVYWTLQDSKTRFTAVYRPTMFSSVLSGADARIELPVSTEGAAHFTYYLPASSFAQANGSQKGFVSSYNNVEVIISPKTVNTETNESVFTVLDKINKDTITDYYVMVSIVYSTYGQNVGDQPALSEKVDISFDLVGAETTATSFDNQTLANYMTEIEKAVAVTSVRTRILSMLAKNTKSEEIIEYLERLAKTFKSDMISNTYSDFRSHTSGTTSIKTLDNAMIIALKSADITTNATGYKYSAGWVAVDTVAFGSGKGFYTSESGSYIFAGVKIVIEGAATLPGAEKAYTIISKYGLTDFLGVSGDINLNATATRTMVLGSAARMMGAPKGSNAIEYFKTKGYAISGAAVDSAATMQESIYVVMAVYETKTNTKVSTLQVKNYTALANVQGINDRYKPYIQAAFELGVYNNTSMQPRATITVKDLLDLLTALDTRARL